MQYFNVKYELKIAHTIIAFFIFCCSFYTNSTVPVDRHSPKTIRTLPLDSLNKLLLKELTTHQIVMLGDGYHGHYYYLSLVVSFLNSWIDSIEQTPKEIRLPRKLCLVLEYRTDDIKIFYKYLSEGNNDELYSFLAEQHLKYNSLMTTVDYLRFMQGLRQINLRISKLNQGLNENKVELEIFGAETINYFEYCLRFGKYSDELEQQRFEWSAKARDRIAANNIITYFQNHPDFKGFVFYGSAHLLRKLEDKGRYDIMDHAPIYDYFLAHFLDNYFGRNEVSVFVPGWENTGETFIRHLALGAQDPDYQIYSTPYPDRPYPIFSVANKKNLRFLLERYKSYSVGASPESMYVAKVCMEKYYELIKSSYLGVKIQKLSIIDPIFNDLDSLIEEYDALRNIEEIDAWLTDSYDFQYVAKYLSQEVRLTGEPYISNFIDHIFKNDVTLKNIKNRITQYLYINLLWIGSNDEKERSLNFLKRSTGLTYKTPEDWMDWWCSRYNYE